MPNNFDESIIIRCFTTEHMENLKRKDPGLADRLAVFEEQIQGLTEDINPDTFTPGV